MDPKLVTPFIAGALVLWGTYRRVRRSFGRQTVKVGQMWFRVALLTVVGGLIAISVFHDGAAVSALFGGVLCGLALGYLGIRHTQFEVTSQGRFYTPHTYIGLFVTALFVGRVVYRYVTVYSGQVPAPAGQNVFAAYQSSPLTLATFGLLISYYLFFSLGVLRKTRALAPAAEVPAGT